MGNEESLTYSYLGNHGKEPEKVSEAAMNEGASTDDITGDHLLKLLD